MRIPLYIEFQGKKVAVIGGGGVGTLRAKKFLEAGARVTVFSLDFSEELERMAKQGEIELVRRDVGQIDFEELAKAYNVIVVAIASREYNDRILEAASKGKALVNLANDAVATEVVVPFEGGRDGIRFAVTTEGKSGVVARKVRDKFQKILDEEEELFYFLDAMNYLKNYMKSHSVPVNLRMKLYSIVSSDREFVRLVKEERVEEARAYAERLVEDYVSGKRKADSGGIEF